MKQTNIQVRKKQNRHKFKIYEAVYVLFKHRPKHLSKKRFNFEWDETYMIIGYVESSPLIIDELREEYLEEGFEYLLGRLDGEFPGDILTAVIVKEEEIRKYYGHIYDSDIKLIIKNYDLVFGNIRFVEPFEDVPLLQSVIDNHPPGYFE